MAATPSTSAGVIFLAWLLVGGFFCHMTDYNGSQLDTKSDSSRWTLPDQRTQVLVFISISARNFVVGPAFDLAWEEINVIYPHIQFKRILYESPPESQGNCDDFVDQIGDQLGKFWGMPDYDEDWIMLTSDSGCTLGIMEQAAFAREWNCLLISSAGSGSMLGDKTLYPTLIRFSPSLTKEYAMCLKKLLGNHNWRHLTMLCDSDDIVDNRQEDFTSQGCDDFQAAMKELRTSHSYFTYDFSVNLTDPVSRSDALKNARRYSAVILIMAHMDKVRSTMITAWNLGMVNENFAYITFSPFPDDSDSRGRWGWRRNDSDDEIARQAYTSLLYVSLSRLKITPLLQNFFAYVQQQSTEKYNQSHTIHSQHRQRLAMAAFLTARAAAQMVNETLWLRNNLSDGTDIYRRMLDREFLAFDDSKVYINPNGDRSELYAVWGYINNTDEPEEIFYYDVYHDRIFPVSGNHWIRAADIPDSRPLCEFVLESTDCQDSDETVILKISLSVLIPSITILAVLVGGYVRYRYVQSARAQTWILSSTEMDYPHRREGSMIQISKSKGTFMRQASNISSRVISAQQSALRARNRVFYKEYPVWIKSYEYTQGQYSKLVDTEHKRLFTRKLMLHQNIVQFYGIVLHLNHLEIVMEFAPKGSLEDILDTEAFSSQVELKYSFINDLIAGLGFIHASALGLHGNLKATNCLVDRFLTLKLTDFGTEAITKDSKKVYPDDVPEWEELYLAPEILRCNSREVTPKSAEIYTFGILLHQILFECLPFGLDSSNQRRSRDEMSSLAVRAILEKVTAHHDTPFRPIIPPDMYDKNLVLLMKSGWKDCPTERPSLHRISKLATTIPGLDKQISYTEAVMHRLQSFAEELMKEVSQRTQEYKQEKKNADNILYQIIPKSIVEKLQRGEDVPPDMFDEVTVCFTSVTNFSHILSTSQPLEVGLFLNAIFQLLDSIIRTFNVYKVETISDSYLVASGLPERNKQRHSAEIGKMALCILGRCERPQLRLGNQFGPLLLKIGMHTGPCAAAVIGTKMPRYCLFGDTVNTASRMMSFGQGLKIHTSVDAVLHMNTYHAQQFIFIRRGFIEVKGKGELCTYWLVGHNPLPKQAAH